MARNFYRIVWLAGLLLVSLACSLVSGVTEQIGEVKGTAQSVATEVEQGRNLLGTAKAMATQVGESGMLGTAQAMATAAGESGMLETAQAFLTDQAPSLLETGQAFATQQGPGLAETARAVATQAAAMLGDAPADIPLVGGEREDFFGSDQAVSYTTALSFAEVLLFYKTEMPNNSWQKADDGWLESENSAILVYEKADRKATVTLGTNPLDNKTIVLIVIAPR